MKIFEVTGKTVNEDDVQYLPVDKNAPEFQQMRAQNAAARAAAPATPDPLKTDPGLRALYDPKTWPTPAPQAATQQPAAPVVQNTAPVVQNTAPAAPKPPTPPAPPAQPQAPAPAANPQTYTVKPGDTLTKIAAQMGTNLQALLQANPQFKANPNLIKPGQTVNPPGAAPAIKPGAKVTQAPATPSAPTPPVAPATPAAPAPAVTQPATAPQPQAPGSKYYVQPAKVGMNGEMDYVVVDRERGVEMKSFNSQAEADAWIKQQPVSESLSRLLQIAGVK